MEKFYNENGETFFILYKYHSRALLQNCKNGEYVVVSELYDQNWWQGTYFGVGAVAYKEAVNYLFR